MAAFVWKLSGCSKSDWGLLTDYVRSCFVGLFIIISVRHVYQKAKIEVADLFQNINVLSYDFTQLLISSLSARYSYGLNE